MKLSELPFKANPTGSEPVLILDGPAGAQQAKQTTLGLLKDAFVGAVTAAKDIALQLVSSAQTQALAAVDAKTSADLTAIQQVAVGLVGQQTETTTYATELYGRTVTPVRGGSPIAAPVTAICAVPVAHTGKIIALQNRGYDGGGSFHLRRYTRSGTTYTQIGDDLAFVTPAGGVLDVSGLDYAVQAGEYIGLVGYANDATSFTGYTTDDNCGWLIVQGDVVIAHDPQPLYQARVEISLIFRFGKTTSTYVPGITDRLAALEGAVTSGTAVPRMRIVCDGNSEMSGGLNPDSPTTYFQALVPSAEVINCAVGGHTTQDMIREAAARIDPLITGTPAGSIPVLIALEIANDALLTGATPVQSVDRMRDYCLGRRALIQARGGLIGVFTVPPIIYGDKDMKLYNAELRARYIAARNSKSAFADFLVDIEATDPAGAFLYPELLDRTDRRYYHDDAVHWTSAADKIAARAAWRALRLAIQDVL